LSQSERGLARWERGTPTGGAARLASHSSARVATASGLSSHGTGRRGTEFAGEARTDTWGVFILRSAGATDGRPGLTDGYAQGTGGISVVRKAAATTHAVARIRHDVPRLQTACGDCPGGLLDRGSMAAYHGTLKAGCWVVDRALGTEALPQVSVHTGSLPGSQEDVAPSPCRARRVPKFLDIFLQSFSALTASNCVQAMYKNFRPGT
jgi:hypothetical protein